MISTQVWANCRTGNTSQLCFLEDGIIEEAFGKYWLASRGVGRRTKIGDTMREIVAKSKAVLGRLESAADLDDGVDLGGATAAPFNAKPALEGLAKEIDAAAVCIEAVKGKVDRLIRNGAVVKVLEVVPDGTVAP